MEWNDSNSVVSSPESVSLSGEDGGKNAARERSRVASLRIAFQQLQIALPTVPPDTKLSKLDILILATDYIAYLASLLTDAQNETEISTANHNQKYLHPIKKWPMRARLYAGSDTTNQASSPSVYDHQYTGNSFGDNLNEITNFTVTDETTILGLSSPPLNIDQHPFSPSMFCNDLDFGAC